MKKVPHIGHHHQIRFGQTPLVHEQWFLFSDDSAAPAAASFGAMNGNVIHTGGSPAGTTPTPGILVDSLLDGVDRMRFLRFHVLFSNDPATSVVGNPEVHSIRIDFGN
jgi:hypothetical protein